MSFVNQISHNCVSSSQSVQVSDEILRRCKEIAAELFGEDQSWGNRAAEIKVSVCVILLCFIQTS